MIPQILTRFVFCIALLISTFDVRAQVGIGTTNLAAGSLLQLESTNSAFVLPRMADAQMTAIASPPVGSMVFNSSDNIPYFNGPSGWTGFDIKSNPSIILSRNNGTFATSTSVSYFMSLTSSQIVSNSSAYFSVPSAATVKVNRSGTYLLSVSFSTTNMPAGDRNYYLAAYKNGVLIGYLSKSKLQNPSTDYWGTTGTLMYPADAGDQFSFKYFISHNANLNTAFQTICITKLN